MPEPRSATKSAKSLPKPAASPASLSRPPSAAAAVTGLILEVLRLNGALLRAGDRLVADIGLTSARWQVLGAVALAPSPAPVAWLARSMGLHRQGVQRIVDELAQAGIVAFAANPHHRRAKLVVLTARGRRLFAAAARRQAPWAKRLAKGHAAGALAAATALLSALAEALNEER